MSEPNSTKHLIDRLHQQIAALQAENARLGKLIITTEFDYQQAKAENAKQAERIKALEAVAEAALVLHKRLKIEDIWYGTYDLPMALRAAGYGGKGNEFTL